MSNTFLTIGCAAKCLENYIQLRLATGKYKRNASDKNLKF